MLLNLPLSFAGIRVMLLAYTDLEFGQNLFIFFIGTLFLPGSSHPKHGQLKFLNFIPISIKLHPASFSPLGLPVENFLSWIIIQNSLLD